MMKRGLLGLALVVSVSSPAFALDDLESILGGKAVDKKEDILQHSTLVTAIKSEIGNVGSEQQVFFRKIEAQNWTEALIQFGPAFSGSAYEKSASGRALKAFLEFKSGLTVSGVENLFAIGEPKKIHVQILQVWKDSLPSGSPVWEMASLTWGPAWTDVFGPVAEVKVRLRDILGSRDVDFLKATAQKTEAQSQERAFVYWQLVLAYSLKDQADLAAKILAQLMQTEKAPVSQELMTLTAARLLYQNGYFEAAQRYYEKVPKTSEYWLEAQEELAWSSIRRGKPQDALAYTKTLVNPAFKGQVGPESYFVRSLSQLKICDYPGVIATLEQFPKIFKARSVELQKISKDPAQPAVAKALEKIGKSGTGAKRLRIEDLGADAQVLPRFLVRDEKLHRLLDAQAYFEAEAKKSEQIYAQSLSLTGLQAEFETLKAKNLGRAEQARAASMNRVKQMAAVEVEETHQMIQKLHIVEAEVIQQVEAAQRLTKLMDGKTDAKLGTTGSVAKDTLKFPVENEVWFDELSQYKVDIRKGCQARKTL